MNKLSVLAAAVLLGLGSGAQAQSCNCSGAEQVKEPALTTTLTGNTVCVAKPGGWEVQEQHRPGGQLWDYKRGSGHPVDPTAQVGTWAISGSGANSAVTHSYGANVYSYKVCQVGTSITNYGFCPTGGGPTIMLTIKPGLVGC